MRNLGVVRRSGQFCPNRFGSREALRNSSPACRCCRINNPNTSGMRIGPFPVLLLFLLLRIDYVIGAEDTSNPNLLRLQKEKKKTISKEEVKRRCQKQGSCSELPADCLTCSFNTSCVYGQEVQTECRVLKGVVCDVRHDSLVFRGCLTTKLQLTGCAGV